MSARIRLEGELRAERGSALDPLDETPVIPLVFDNDDQFGGPALPSDHPAWLKDAISLSQRARGLIARLPPVVTHVVRVWEHRVRTLVVAGRRLSVDASGSYRIE